MNAAAIEIQAVRAKRLIVVDDLPSEPGVTQPVDSARALASGNCSDRKLTRFDNQGFTTRTR